MSREIKFRGKVADEPNEWVYGYLVSEDSIFQSKETEYTKCCGFGTFAVIPETIGQFTGLKDKNGKDIFEGDILKIPEWLQMDIQDKCICIYNEEHQVSDIIGFGLYTKDGYSGEYKILVPSDEWDEFEVIGSIWQNPELLEV